MTFYEKLSRLALRKGQSPRAAVIAMELDPSAAAQWKRRGTNPSPEIAKKMADYFGVEVEMLMDAKRALPDPSDAEIMAAMESPTPPEVAAEILGGLKKGVTKMQRDAEAMPSGATLADLLTIEEKLRAIADEVAEMRERTGGKPSAKGKFTRAILPSQTQPLSTATGKPIPAASRGARSA